MEHKFMKTAFAIILTVLFISVTAMGQPPKGDRPQGSNGPEAPPPPIVLLYGRVTLNMLAPHAGSVSLVGDFAITGNSVTGDDATPLGSRMRRKFGPLLWGR